MRKTFKIPLLPPSINTIYKINYVTRSTYKSKEAREFENYCKLFTPAIRDITETQKVKTYIELHGSWYFKNGAFRKKDIQNLDKVLIDSIFEKLGIDDSQIWDHHLIKVEDKEEFTLITLEVVDE